MTKEESETVNKESESALLHDAEIMFDENEENTSEESGSVNSLIDIIKAFNTVLFSKKEIKQKSHLTRRKIRGIIRACSFNDYMEKEYKYRFTVLDSVALNALELNKSASGYAFDKTVDGLKSIGQTIQVYDEKSSTLGKLTGEHK